MGFGIAELVSLLLSLAGFGITANPKAPSVDQALEYAMPDADLVVHLDVGAIVPNNYKLLVGLADQPQIKSSPELSKILRQAVGEVEGARGMVKSSTGIDLTTDVNDATMFVQFVAGGRDPNVLVVAHGKFTSSSLDRIASMTGNSTSKIGAGTFLAIDRNSAAGVTKTNAILAGSTQLVKDRLADTWKAPARPKDSNLAYAAEVIGGKPVYAAIVTMSPAARKVTNEKLGEKGPNFGTDLVDRHKLAAFSLYANGIGWEWIDTKAGGVDQIATMSEGIVELFRAGQIAPRGIAKVLMAGLESYKGVDKKIDDVLAQKANLMKIVDQFTGDGKFVSKIDKSGNKLTVRLTGKSVSEVVPFSMAIPAMSFFWMVERRAAPAPMPPPPPPRVVPQPKPRGTGLTK